MNKIEKFYQLNQEDRNKIVRLAIAFTCLAVLILLIFLVFWSSDSYTNMKLSFVSSDASLNFAHADGDRIMLYNGISFYSTDLSGGDVKVMLGGKKIPTPTKVFWAGDRGVIFNSKSPVYGTSAEKALRDSGRKIDFYSTLITWFLDFNTGELKPVNNSPILSDYAFYSKKDKGVYYITDQSEINSSHHSRNNQEVYFYDIDKNISSTVYSGERFVNISRLGQCPDNLNGSLCLIHINKNNTQLTDMTMIKDGATETILSDRTLIAPTNNSQKYITTKLQQEPEEGQGANSLPEFAESDSETAYVYDFDTENETQLELSLEESDLVAGFISEHELYILDNELVTSEEDAGIDSEYHAIKFSFKGVNSSQKKLDIRLGLNNDSVKLGDSLFSNASFTNGGYALTTSYTNYQYLFTRDDALYSPTRLSSEETSGLIDECSNIKGFDYYEQEPSNPGENKFRIFFEDPNLIRGLRSLTDCLVKQDKDVLNGNYFTVSGIDPVNQSVVTF